MRETIREKIQETNSLGALGKGLTSKQKRFAEEVAKGETGAEAYRRAYNTKAKPNTVKSEACKLKAHPNVAQTIEAINRANEVMKYQTSEGLRSLAISSLVEVITNPDTSPAVRVQCAKIIGTMTEVSLFTHRTESKVIHSSDDIRAKILSEINTLMKATAEDVTEKDVVSLLNELSSGPAVADQETHPDGGPTNDAQESHENLHTIPQPLSEENLDPLNLKTTVTDFDAP